MIALCLKYLHRHPLELGHLPAWAILDLIAMAELEEEAMRSLERSEVP